MACGNCRQYKAQGHNYCRMCGSALNPGFAKHTRVAAGYMTNEKYCGYCGGNRFNCPCVSPAADAADRSEQKQPDSPGTRRPWWRFW